LLHSKNDKRVAIAQLVISSVSILIKLLAIAIAIPIGTYLSYTDNTKLMKMLANVLFILAQVIIIVWVIIFLKHLDKDGLITDTDVVK